MNKRYRFILLTLTFVLLHIIGIVLEGSLNNLMGSFWYTSGLLLLILLSLVDQPYFSKDSNIFLNSITGFISLQLVDVKNQDNIYRLFIIIILYLAISSYFLMILRKNNLSEENNYIQFFSRFNRIIGKPDVLFSAFFLWGAVIQYTSQSSKFNALLLFWIVFKLLSFPELAKIIDGLFVKKTTKHDKSIGSILGVQSQNTFLVKINNGNNDFDLFNFVEMKYSVDKRIYRGLICEMMLLDQEQWIKVVTNDEIYNLFCDGTELANHIEDGVYIINTTPLDDILKRFIGIITEGSTINKTRFLYNSSVEISEGNLLEVKINNYKVLYQIVEGKTVIEQLSNKNQSGFIVGEAVQLGKWNIDKYQFEKFGWVPKINTPLYLAQNINEIEIHDDEIIIGYLPETNYPVIINKTLAITHHTAIVGVTGTGKSVFSRNLIREYLKDEQVKVICIDFTGEYQIKFSDMNPTSIINSEQANGFFGDIDFIESQMDGNYNKDTTASLERKKKLFKEITECVDIFIKSDESNLSIFELPEVQNTSGVMKYTQTFFKALFKVAKENKNHGKKVCLVLEEAHTIIPEWNFAGISEKISQPLINSIAQIALQGRKYDIGLLVIAQRTANVSKTILTQCNSVIAFQEFDKTSIDFLSNYFGADIANSLAKLKFRQAIAAGKAFRASVPMIFEVPEIKEEYIDCEECE